MDEREQKMALERFLSHHGIELLPWARPPQFGRRLRRFFPEIADRVNPDRRPWHAKMIEALAQHVATLDPSDLSKDEHARPFHVAKKHRNLNRTKTFLLGWEWRQLRYETLKERGARCELCGATSEDQRIEVDHIRPISKHWELRLSKEFFKCSAEHATKAKAIGTLMTGEYGDFTFLPALPPKILTSASVTA